MSFDIPSGQTETVEAGSTRFGGPVNLDGTLDLDGTLNTTGAASVDASGTGTATGTADAAVFLSLRKSVSATIDETRRDDFDTQGVGDVDD